MAEDNICGTAQGGGCNGLHELACIHFPMARNLESRGYTCLHQLQSDRGSFATFREDVNSTPIVCGSEDQATVHKRHH